jgi:hypothetical protein
MRRSKKFQYSLIGVFIAIAFVCSAMPSAIFYLDWRNWGYDSPGRRFDSSEWKMANLDAPEQTVRSEMVNDLLERHNLRGMSRDEVVDLLGVPTLLDDEEWDFQYYIGRDLIDTVYLVFHLDHTGCVDDYRLLHGER